MHAPSLLLASGTDPLGGAGLYAHAHIALRAGVSPLYAPTALVLQNSRGIDAIHPIDPSLLARTLDVILRDVTPAAALIGVVGAREGYATLTHALAPFDLPLVIDPVLRGGGPGNEDLGETAAAEGIHAMLTAFGPRAVLTPNTSELARLVGSDPATSVPSLTDQARALATRTGATILAKGGTIDPAGTDVLVTAHAICVLPPGRAPHREVHGTGCRLAAELAVRLAHGLSLRDAVIDARHAFDQAMTEEVHRVGGGRPQFSFRSPFPFR